MILQVAPWDLRDGASTPPKFEFGVAFKAAGIGTKKSGVRCVFILKQGERFFFFCSAAFLGILGSAGLDRGTGLVGGRGISLSFLLKK